MSSALKCAPVRGSRLGGLRLAVAVLLLPVSWLRAAPGNVDTGFNPNSSLPVFAVAMQPDGKILISGSFIVGGIFRTDIVRLDADGTPEGGFYPNADGGVDSVAVQADGKILIGGVFTSVGGVARNHIARVNADGTLDTNFDPGANAPVYAVALQADGKILLGGEFTSVGGRARNRIARLNADGTVDTGFDANVDNFVNSVAVQADGKILLGGKFTSVGGKWRVAVARLNADGAVDIGFAPSGSKSVYSVAVQADGKILLGGSFTSMGGATRNRIARLSADGTLDTGFDPNANGEVVGVAVQADGKILLGGGFTSVRGTARNYIARVNADGTLDTNFDPDANAPVNAVVLQADGKVLLGGTYTFSRVGGVTRNRVARLANDATTQSLATEGSTRAVWLRGGAAPEVSAVAFEFSTDGGSRWTALGDGTRVSGGWELGGLALPTTGLLRARGRTSGGFFNGSSGLVEQVQAIPGSPAAPVVTAPTSTGVTTTAATLGGDVVSASNSALTERGVVYAATAMNAAPRIGGTGVAKVAVAGTTGVFTTEVTGLAEGTGYSYAAYATNAAGTTYTSVATFTTQPANTDAKLAALALSDGTLSPAFASATTSYRASVRKVVSSITVTPTLMDALASVMVNGVSVASGSPSGAIHLAEGANTITVQVTSRDGTVVQTYTIELARTGDLPGDLDPDFDPNLNNSVFGVAVQPDGRILLGGDFTSVGGTTRNRIARINADGTLDAGFDPNADNLVFSIAVQPDGKIVLGGNFFSVGGTSRHFIARVNANGTLDTGFNPILTGSVESIAVQADGKILIGGVFRSVDGTTRNHIARLNANGTLDTAFNPDADPSIGSGVQSVAVQADGKIVMGGSFTSVGGTARHFMARVKADGTLDAGFDPNVGSSVNSTLPVQTIVVQADGKILLGGQFTSVSGATRNHIARLNVDGTLDTGFNPNANSEVLGIAVQADGKILLVGGFFSVGGTTRKGLARLNADGMLDAGFAPSLFAPNLNGAVNGVALEADGKILLVGGAFGVGGTAHNHIARLTNEAGTQTLAASGATRVEWLRGGAAPEISAVTFELSSDGGSTWALLGAGTRIVGGWELTGLALPATGSLRARGRTSSGGFASGDSGLVEQVRAFPLSAPVVTVAASTGVRITAATFGGDVTSDGNATITERGIVFAPTAINRAPRIDGTGVTTVTVSGTTGVFTVDVTGFAPGTDYSYAIYATNAAGTTYTSVRTFTTHAAGAAATLGGSQSFSAATVGSGPFTYQWRRNGGILPDESGASLILGYVQPGDTGVYAVEVSAGGMTTTNEVAVLGLNITGKIAGAGAELSPADIRHPNGNIFDQVLLTGVAETITADAGQITRTSFVDLDDDIVQVEFSGPGTLSLVLENATGPAAPVNYNQATNYMKGHAGIVIAGATEATNVSVFSVGKATAVNQALFKDGVKYDGIADIAFIAILSSNGKFGGVRTANAAYFAAKGLTGIYAPGVAFQGPVFIGNITAFDTATPVIQIGAVGDARITGGDLAQANGAEVQVKGLTQLKFTPGSDSHGNALPAQANQAVLKQDGVDVTAQIVVNP